jgi:hypothetical protein
MKIPEFTAAASLHRMSNNHRSPAPGRASPKRTAVIPQLGGKEFKGFSGCMDDCIDRHPELTPEQAKPVCTRICSDPFMGHDLSTSGSGLNDFLSSAGIDFWEGACSLYGHPVPCRLLANVIRGQS